ncbi:MAG: O-antigen ligase family protein [Acidobacteria bacterium]|nr:O-antigen ligase family protein [Acidobacteriota bacterium]
MSHAAAINNREWAAPSVFTAVHLGRLRVFLIVAIGFAMPFSKVILASGKLINFAVADAVLPLALFFLIWTSLRGGIRLPAMPLFCLTIIVLLVSTVINLDLTLRFRGPVSLVVESVKAMLLWLYFYSVVNLVGRRSDFVLLLKAWMASSVFVSLSGVFGSLAFQYVGLVTPFSLMYRAQGTFEDCNLYAAHLSLSIFLTLVFRQVTGSRSWWTWFVIASNLAGIFYSASRGSLLALAISGGILWLFFSTMRAKVVAGVALVAVVCGLAAVPNLDRVLESNPITKRLATSTVDLHDPEAGQRRMLWEEAVREFLQSPVLGVGRANYGLLAEPLPEVAYAHNTYLSLLAETGLAGFLCYAGFAGSVLFLLGRNILTGRFGDYRLAASFVLMAVLTIALDGVTINIENYRGLWIALAITECFRRLYSQAEARS